MTMENVCLFNKYGFCKFRENCRKIHYEETCNIESCETNSCAKRHPTKCRYFNLYNRCKFGTFCLFSHEAADLKTNYNEDEENRVKIATLEARIVKLENETNLSNDKIRNLEDRNEVLESKLVSALENMKTICEAIVKKATDTVVEIFSKQQDESERKQRASFDLLSNQISTMISQLQKPPATNSQQPQPCSQPSDQTTYPPASVATACQAKFQCIICGKTFGSSRALTNHMRKDHEPNS